VEFDLSPVVESVEVRVHTASSQIFSLLAELGVVPAPDRVRVDTYDHWTNSFDAVPRPTMCATGIAPGATL
jgi:hypothetical protein